jgi:Uncharacterized membrane protein
MLWDFILRLFLAGIFGAAIGIEREYRAKGAGFRTHFLVSVGSALMMIVSMYGFDDVINGVTVRLDPSRIAGQVITGVGFIGAGTIILQKQVVRGLTTAAGIFAVAGIGLATGAGMYWLALIATGLVLIGMEVMVITHRRAGGTSTMITYSSSAPEQLKKISEEVLRMGFRIISYEMTQVSPEEGSRYRVEAVYNARRHRDEDALLHYIQSLSDVFIEKIE